MALFRAKFACILAISNPVFRWESCKDSERECEEMLKIVQGCRDSRLDSRVTRDWQAAKVGICLKHAGELKSHVSCCTTGHKSQAGQAVSSQLELATQPSREAKSPDHPIWEKLD